MFCVILPIKGFYQPANDDGEKDARQEFNNYAKYPEI